MRSWLAYSCLAVLLSTGCGGGGPATVTGAVTLDGMPVGAGSPGTIRFQPVDAAGQAAEGFVVEGRYEVQVFPGRYDVTIRWEKWPDPSTTRGKKPPPGFDEIPPTQMVPQQYSQPGVLAAEVAPRGSRVDFSLATK